MIEFEIASFHVFLAFIALLKPPVQSIRMQSTLKKSALMTSAIVISLFTIQCGDSNTSPRVRRASDHSLFFRQISNCPESLRVVPPETVKSRFLPFRSISDIPADSRALLFQWYAPESGARNPTLWLGRYYDLATVYLDGEQVWQTPSEEGRFRGIEWNLIPLPDRGVEITVCFQLGSIPSFARAGPLDPMIIGSASEVLEHVFRSEIDDLGIMSISLALSITGMALFFFWPPMRKPGMLYLSLLLLNMSLYQLSTSSISQLIAPNALIRLALFSVGCAMFPPVFTRLVSSIFDSKSIRWISYVLFVAAALSLGHNWTAGGMHIAGWAAAYSGATSPIIVLGVMVAAIGWIFRGIRKGWILLFAMLPFFLSALFEYLGVVFGLWGENAFSGRWTFLVFQVGLAVIVMTQINQLRMAQEKSQEQKYQSGRSVAENRYRTLQERMAPHFLFNSLNLIHSYIERGNPRAGDAIMMLASHYRYLINDMERRLVLFDQEWEFSRRYCQLVQFRFEDHLRIEMERHGDFSGVFIPPLTIQPIIENAYQHGLRDYTSNGIIQVLAHVQDEEVRIQVLDNGRGIDQNSNYVSSIGGVERRLQENFQQARITMSRRADRGTCVEIAYRLEPLALEEDDPESEESG
ncbi:MAG: histidine kinase [Leptospiraceae bacterium]